MKKLFFFKCIIIASLLIISIIIWQSFRNSSSKIVIQTLLQDAGISINGNKPYDITIYNEKTFDRVLSQGSLGLGESYMDGWWDCQALDQFFFRLLRAAAIKKTPLNGHTVCAYIKATFLNLQSPARAYEVGKVHYDLDNELFSFMLDPYMQYSCGYWKEAKNLAQAQEAKLDLICRKLHLKPGMSLLDIGCGWGGFAYYAAKKYGVHVLGVTISKEQADYAREWTKDLPVEIRLQDYRDVQGSFDRIVSVGMFEHVGYKNYDTFMKIAHRLLKDDGIMLLHTIGNCISQTYGDAWLNKYIFPNGMLPSILQIGKAIEGTFVMEDWHNFGADYDKTLMAWWENFNAHWSKLQHVYDQQFYRMWKYYLLSCAGLFRSRQVQLWQIVLSKYGVLGGYQSIR